MKKICFSAVIAAGLMTNVYADDLPQTSGDVGVFGGVMRIVDSFDSGGSGAGQTYGGAARINKWLSPTESAQFDLSMDYSRLGRRDGDVYRERAFDLAAHFNRRQADELIGGMVSVGRSFGAETWESGHLVTFAGEAQKTYGDDLFYLQAGYTIGVSPSNNESGPYVRLEARRYLDANTMVSANIGYAHMYYTSSSSDGKHAIRHKSFGLDAEHRFDGSNFSAFASYQGSHNDEPLETGEVWQVHSFMVGVKYTFGGTSLQEASRTGATLADYNPYTGVDRLRFSDWE